MKALLGRLEGYREIGPNSTPQNTSLQMDPTSSTLGGLLHENGFQGGRPATENEIAISNDNIGVSLKQMLLGDVSEEL
jgi:hypothetical protein